LQDIKEAISLFTSIAAEKMRKQKSAARLLTVFLRTNPFKDTPQYHNGCMVELPVPTQITSELLGYASKAVEQIYREGYIYQKAGVMLTDFVPYSAAQFALFDSENRQKTARLTEIIDKINAQMGSGTLFFASTGIKRLWRTRRDMESPHYTTNWDELPKVKAGE
jgi:DNA polymerase V